MSQGCLSLQLLAALALVLRQRRREREEARVRDGVEIRAQTYTPANLQSPEAIALEPAWKLLSISALRMLSPLTTPFSLALWLVVAPKPGRGTPGSGP